MTRLRILFVVVFFGVAVVNRTSADDLARSSMEGLTGIGVRITVTSEDQTFPHVVTEGLVQTKVELRLRRAGIRVFSDAELQVQPRWAVCNVEVTATDGDINDPATGKPLSYAVATIVTLNQAVVIPGGSNSASPKLLPADTWQNHTVTFIGRDKLLAGYLQKSIDDLVDSFANDWLAAHQKASNKKP